MLDHLNAGLAFYAGKGVRVMPRFVYNFGPIGAPDAQIGVISNHIDQIAPILLANKDLIFGLEAGFIGTWGEWHDSTKGNDTPAAQKIVLDKELSYFGSVFPIFVRYPADLITYTGKLAPDLRLGLHDDYYASAPTDAGTFDWPPRDPLPGYSSSQLMSYAAAVSTVSMFIGEFGALYPTFQSCSALDTFSYTYHPQSISLNIYPADIGTELVNEGCALRFLNKVGTRIELQKVTVQGNPVPNGTLNFAITLANAGYGRVIRPRPATLVLASSGTTVGQTPIPLAQLDLRVLSASSLPVPQTFQFGITLPPTLPSGQISAFLLIPDPAPSLTSQAVYALPFNSLDVTNNAVFNPTTGYNLLATFNAALSSSKVERRR